MLLPRLLIQEILKSKQAGKLTTDYMQPNFTECLLLTNS